MSKEERFIYHCDNYDYDEIIYDTKKGYDYVSLQTVAKTLNKQDAKIADLEAKLADAEKCAIDFQNQNTELEKDIAELKTENMNIFEYSQKLEQQLAEKEKEIEEVRSNHANLVADIAYKAVNVYTAESRKTGVPTFYKIHYSDLLEIEDMANLRNYAQDKAQDKIELLEKVREIVNSAYQEPSLTCYGIINKIDTLIKEIKGE